MPFREITDVRQPEPGLQRRWFRADSVDVLVDHCDGAPRQLSITYTWQNQPMELFCAGDQQHNHVLDDGEARPGRMKSTPIAGTQAPVPAVWLRTLFHDGDGLPNWLSSHIRDLLDRY